MVQTLTDQGMSEKALGAAFSTAGRASIFPGRIREHAANTPTTMGELMGRVMAHEIGHLFLPGGYSHSGIMSAGMETDPGASARFTLPQTRALRALLESWAVRIGVGSCAADVIAASAARIRLGR